LIVQLFAEAREAVGADSIALSDPPATAGEVLTRLAADPRIGAIAARSRLAVNHAFARPDTAVSGEDEVALIPPVGGG
jgi:molybdopterin converting factor small subunit